MTNEVWKDIKDYEGLYKVSDLGRVKGLKTGKILKPSNDKGGYYIVVLSKDGKRSTQRIHQLVALTFVDPNYKEKGLVCDHINNNRTDNRASNLQVITNRENTSKDNNSKTGFTGVYPNNSNFIARINIGKELVYLGTFKTPQEASEVYQNKLKELQNG